MLPAALCPESFFEPRNFSSLQTTSVDHRSLPSLSCHFRVCSRPSMYTCRPLDKYCPAFSAVFTGTDASDRYIGITVKGIGPDNSDADILPRLRLVTSPYAYMAAKVVPGACQHNYLSATACSPTVPPGWHFNWYSFLSLEVRSKWI